MIKYVKFISNNDPIDPSQCTTRWPESVACNIPISGTIEGSFINLMIMDGTESEINNWISVNIGKVIELTKDEANSLGQELISPGTEITVESPEGESEILVAGIFNVDDGLLWTKK